MKQSTFTQFVNQHLSNSVRDIRFILIIDPIGTMLASHAIDEELSIRASLITSMLVNLAKNLDGQHGMFDEMIFATPVGTLLVQPITTQAISVTAFESNANVGMAKMDLSSLYKAVKKELAA